MKQSAHQSLRRLQFLRLFEIGGQLAALAVAVFWLKLALPLAPILAVIGALTTLTLLTWPRLASPRPVAELELFAQLLVDVTAFSLLLYFTGGATNPFVSAYLLPLSIAAALLSAPYAWAMSAITVACYTLLLYFYVPLPGMEHQMPMTTLMGSGDHSLHVHGAESSQFGMHVIGMWLNFVGSAGLITFFVQRIAGSLRERERELAAAREETLRNERIVALGTLAAGTAHELGTPLATVAVVAQDLQNEFANDPELGPQLALIRNQVTQCKAVLQRLVDSVGQLNAEEKRMVSLAHYVTTIAERWRLLWPNTPLAVRGSGNRAIIRIDSTLEQAVLNLLNNAAQASPSGIELEIETQDKSAVLRIIDRGPGPAPDVIVAAGKTFLPDRSESGMGIGLYLANATIERLGGTVRLFSRATGGCTEIALPLVDVSSHE